MRFLQLHLQLCQSLLSRKGFVVRPFCLRRGTLGLGLGFSGALGLR